MNIVVLLKNFLVAFKAISGCIESDPPPAGYVSLWQLSDPDENDKVAFRVEITSKAHEDQVMCIHDALKDMHAQQL